MSRLSPEQLKAFKVSRRQNYEKTNSRASYKKFLIICEGRCTEPNYFRSFEKDYKNIDIRVFGEGRNTLYLVENASKYREDLEKKYGQKFDSCWVVFDKDNFNDDAFDNAISKSNGINFKCAWTNEAFELWYLLHFEYRNTSMKRDEYESKISKYICKKYTKTATDMYDILKKHQDKAIKNAEQLNNTYQNEPCHKRNPCTLVYELVKDIKTKATKKT